MIWRFSYLGKRLPVIGALIRIFIPWLPALGVFSGAAGGETESFIDGAPHTKAAVVKIGEFTPRNCPLISDKAVIVAKIVAANSGAPDTEHPGVDLWISDHEATNVIRIHFGDRGDGTNSCLPYDDCENMEELPISCPVRTAAVKNLLHYLSERNYRVGRFVSWGIPFSPWGARGSNCGDAFVATIERLGIASEALPAMREWARLNQKGKWAFDRGRRRPADPFFAGINSKGGDRYLCFRGPLD